MERRRTLLRWARGLFVALLAQSILGIGLNLYVTLPSSVTITQVFVTAPLLTAHIILGLSLVVLTALLLIRARSSSIPGLVWRSALVLACIVLAVQEGFAFVFTGDNAFSFGMMAGFVLAVGFQTTVLFRIAQAGVAGSAVVDPSGGQTPL